MAVLRPMLPPPSQPRSSTATLVTPWSFAQVVGGGQTVAAGADDYDVVGRLRLSLAPGGGPVAMAAQAATDEVGERVELHARPGCPGARAG